MALTIEAHKRSPTLSCILGVENTTQGAVFTIATKVMCLVPYSAALAPVSTSISWFVDSLVMAYSK
jgi:hypothetical protein